MPDKKLKGIRVLIVDDNECLRLELDVLLNGFGCETSLAENGKQAIEKVKESEYDVILLDINMPILGGFETARIIKRDLKKNARIIAVSSSLGKHICLNSDIDSYIKKPFDIADIVEAVCQNALNPFEPC